MHILLVEDNKSISQALEYTFKQHGYEVSLCFTYLEAINVIGKYNYDLMIFDVTLPDGDGFKLYANTKDRINDTPVLFLTAKDDVDDIVYGLELGAEDYITKPFSTKELLARIKKILNRKLKKVNNMFINDIEVDFDKRIVKKGGEIINLTALEYCIFELFAQNPSAVLTRDLLLEKIWEMTGNDVNDNTLTVYIRRIRSKLQDENIILTIKRVGYRLNV